MQLGPSCQSCEVQNPCYKQIHEALPLRILWPADKAFTPRASSAGGDLDGACPDPSLLAKV